MTQLPMPGLGARIARLRRRNGWSARELAEVAGAGLTRSVIANIESGRRQDLPLSQFLAVCLALQVPPAALLVETLDAPDSPLDLPFPLATLAHPADRARDSGTLGGVVGWLNGERAPVESERRPSADDWARYVQAVTLRELMLESLRELMNNERGPVWRTLPPIEDRATAIDAGRQQLQWAEDRLRELGVDLAAED